MKPYYTDRLVTLYHGDAREILPALCVPPEETVVITDPVWPNALPSLAGAQDPAGLFAQASADLARLASRWIVILGIDSDPRFLAGVPISLPFFRLTWLRYACPSYKGPKLILADAAYVFGSWRMAYKGQRVFPGKIVATRSRARDKWKTGHPCPRRLEHLEGLVRGYTRRDDIILDPFAGSGTTIEAAARFGRRVVACEIEERWCEEIARRCPAAVAQSELPFPELSNVV